MTLVTDQSETPGEPAAGDHIGNGPEQETAWAVGALERTRGMMRLEVQLLFVLVFLYLVFSAIEPDIFLSVRTVENLARQAGVLLVASVGQMLVLVVGGFDISVGATAGFASTALALLVDDFGLYGAVTAALALGALVGSVNGLVIAYLGVNPFVATLAMLTFLTGLSNELSSGASVPITDRGVSAFGADEWGPLPGTMGVGLVVVFIAYLLLNRVRAGLYIYAIGGARETSRLSGISVARYEVLAYAMCGLFAATAGVMLASRVTLGQASLGAGLELESIAAAVIGGAAIGGGVGRLLGAAMGVGILTVLTSGLEIVGVSEFARQMVTGVVLVVAVAFNQRRRIGEWAIVKRVTSLLRGSGARLSGP